MATNELISKRLRKRIRVLGDLLGETMAADHGEEFLEKEEEIRQLAKSRRQDESGGQHKLQEVLATLDDDDLISIARAFNQFLNLTNIAEQAESTEKDDDSHLEALLNRLTQAGIGKQEIYEAVSNMRCDLVLTAHPTEITRRTLIAKYNRIASSLKFVNEEAELEADKRSELERLIAEVWFTDEIRTERPTPQDEATWGYAVIENSLWTALPQLWNRLDELMLTYTDQHLDLRNIQVDLKLKLASFLELAQPKDLKEEMAEFLENFSY